MATATTAHVGSATTARDLAPRRGRRVPVPLLVALAGAWALAVGSYLVHAAWIVPIVVLLLSASLLRGGRTLLDRIVLATALLYGAVCLGGVVLSVWPWRLHPVPVGGVALTALVVFAFTTRRRPSLPRPTLADGLSLGAAALVGLVFWFPPFSRGQANQISYFAYGNDGIRHFIEFDTIRQYGGYLFFHPEVPAGMALYPQGWHFFFGLLDGFVRSSPGLGSGLSALDHYFVYAGLTYAAFALALIWGVQRLAEPLLTPARRLVLVAGSVFFLFSEAAFQLALRTYWPQVAGLALVVVLVVVLARPPARTALALWLVSALLVGVGFTYTLYLPPAMLAVLVWLFARRRRLVRHRFAFAAALLAVPLSAVPLGLGLVFASQGGALLLADPAASFDGLLVLAAVATVGLLKSWPAPRWRMFLWPLGISAGCLIGLHVLLGLQGDAGGYYVNKVQDLVVVLLALGGGALLALLPHPQRRANPQSWRHLGRWRAALRDVAPALAHAVALVAGSGLVAGDSPYQHGSNGAVTARVWVSGKWPQQKLLSWVTLSEAQRSVAPGTFTVVMSEDRPQAYLAMTLVSGLKRQYQDFVPGLYAVPINHADYYDHVVDKLPPGPVLLVVDTVQTQVAAIQLAARHRDRDIAIAFPWEPVQP
jgi:hypothetical protein